MESSTGIPNLDPLMLYGIAEPGIGVILVSWMSLDLVEVVLPLASLHHAKGTKVTVCSSTAPVIEGSVCSDLRLRQGNVCVSSGNAELP